MLQLRLVVAFAGSEIRIAIGFVGYGLRAARKARRLMPGKGVSTGRSQ
jgi:hypothetical protein